MRAEPIRGERVVVGDSPRGVPREHAIRCSTCGWVLDMRSLDQVLAHEDACPSAGMPMLRRRRR